MEESPFKEGKEEMEEGRSTKDGLKKRDGESWKKEKERVTIEW